MRTDHPKIYISINGKFAACTTWSRTCREAVERWHNQYGFVTGEHVTARFAK